jgi:hypothetical protein
MWFGQKSSRIFRDSVGSGAGLRKTTGYFLTEFAGFFARVRHGGICLRITANLEACTNVISDGVMRGFGIEYWSKSSTNRILSGC